MIQDYANFVPRDNGDDLEVETSVFDQTAKKTNLRFFFHPSNERL